MFEKKTIVILGGTLLVIAGLIVWGLKDNPTSAPLDPSAIVYYWGDGCPHCKIINEFLDANNIAEKVTFTKKEIWHDKTNASEMAQQAKVCGVQPEGMGVPFVYGGDGKCYVGEPDVRKFFSEKAGIDVPAPKAAN